MSDGALRIPITGDASQFKKTLAQLEADLKGFKEKLKTAKGDQIVEFNVGIQGTKQAINDLTTFGKFAEGTLGRLYQQLEQLKTLRLTIQADATALTPVNNAIDETTKKIKDLLSAGLQKPIVEAAQVSANSIQGLKNRIDELNQKKLNLDAKDDYLQIVKLNQEIDRLKTQINNLNKLGLKVDQTIDPAVNSFRNLTNTSNKSRQALTSLSLVAQDLPFGFIAIQNNLPAVISSFGALNASSNGLRGTLAALGAGLAGPAGLFLAFSVVTGAVTYAIQKYGSLGAAVKEFLGNTTQLDIILRKSTDSLEKYNKELETTEEITGRGRASASGEIIRIQTLASAVRNVTLSEEQRANALKQIQKLDPETLKNIDLQKNGYGDLDKFVKKYTDSLIANAVAQEYLSKVVATTTQINQQSLALQEIAKGYADIAQKRREAEAQPQFDPATGADLTTTILGGLEKAQQNLNERFFAQAKIVSNLYSELNVYKSSLESATLETLNFFKATKNSNEGLDQGAKNAKEFKKELQGVIPLFDLFSPSKEQFNFDLLKDFFGPNFIKQLKEAQKKLNETENQLDKFRKQNADPILIKVVPKVSGEANNKFLEQKKFNEDIIEMLTKGLNLEKAYDNAIEDLLNFSEYSRKEIEKIAKDLRFLQEPLEGLFTTLLEDGKVSWKSFADDVIKQIKRIAAALLSKAIIQGIANILAPGSGAIVGQGLKAIDTAALGDYANGNDWVDLFTGGQGRANYGMIRGERAMAMSGQVNMVIRGNDLVGVMNRTNTTINRVG